jgi:FkbM family methyltransferase
MAWRNLLPRPLRALRWRLPWVWRAAHEVPGVGRPGALWRAARFTMADLGGRDFAFRTPDGALLETMPNNFSSFAMATVGSRDPEIWRFIARHVGQGDVFVDAGANVGAYTLPAARLVGTAGRVIAVEAHPRTHALLARNIAANGLDQAVALHTAIGDVPGELVMAFNEANPGETHVGAGDAGARVPVQRLDDVLAGLGVAQARYLKIDVEGFELPVLRGAAGLIAASPDIAVQTELVQRHADRYGYPLEAVGELLQGLGLRPHLVDEAGGLRLLEGQLGGDVIWRR